MEHEAMTSKPVSQAEICGLGTLWMRERSGLQKLIVKGVVLNASQRPCTVPTLEARLCSAQGQVIELWQFDTATAELQPGASARFRSELSNPPPGAQDIDVRFVPTGTGAAGSASR
jgi:hypothetical protein